MNKIETLNSLWNRNQKRDQSYNFDAERSFAREGEKRICRTQADISTFKIWKKTKLETDTDVLERRQKQIDYGKNNSTYEAYIATIPKTRRTQHMPRTPDKFEKYSRRGWDGAIKPWKIKIHDLEEDLFRIQRPRPKDQNKPYEVDQDCALKIVEKRKENVTQVVQRRQEQSDFQNNNAEESLITKQSPRIPDRLVNNSSIQVNVGNDILNITVTKVVDRLGVFHGAETGIQVSKEELVKLKKVVPNLKEEQEDILSRSKYVHATGVRLSNRILKLRFSEKYAQCGNLEFYKATH